MDDSSAPSIHDSAVRPNPDDKNKSTGRESSSARACTSQNISASKRPSDPGTSSWPLYEEDTEIKLSRGLSAKRIKRSDSAKLSTGESNNSGLHAKMLGGRFQPPQREQPPSNAAKRKVETIKPDQTRAMVARKDSTRSDASFGSTNAKASAKSDMDEAKEKRAASAAKGDESQGRSRIDTSANSSAAAALSSLEYVQVPTAMAMKSRFPPGCVVVHTSDDESTNAYTICSVYLRLSSDELVSGRSNFDVLFKVGTGTNAKILSEESLVYARDCPIFIKSNAVPHVKSQSGWVPATVKSSITLPDALEEDYVVTIANGGTAHVPRVLSVIVIPLCPKVLACRRRLSTRSQHQWRIPFLTQLLLSLLSWRPLQRQQQRRSLLSRSPRMPQMVHHLFKEIKRRWQMPLITPPLSFAASMCPID